MLGAGMSVAIFAGWIMLALFCALVACGTAHVALSTDEVGEGIITALATIVFVFTVIVVCVEAAGSTP
jgi:hypothetical protein